MAETYQILNYRALPVPLLATLCSGLRENSRVKMQIAGMNEISNEVLLINIADTLRLIGQFLSGNKEKPKLLADIAMEKRVIRTVDRKRDAVRDMILEEARARMEEQHG